MTKQIPLTRDQFATVDDADFGYLNQWKWYYMAAGYAARTEYLDGRKSHITMHRQLMNCPAGMTVDHINTNRLDNRRSNLRICSPSQNLKNKRPRIGKKYKGIRLDKGRWRAQIVVDYRLIGLGSFSTDIEAARAYNTAATKYHGEFAHLNPV